MLTGEFVIRKNGKLQKYQNYNDIPNEFEHIISFKPDYPPEPHTKEQHDQMSTLLRFTLPSIRLK